MTRPLGEVQVNVLYSLIAHSGVWYPNCGWYWNNYSGTSKVMRTLVKRGLVDDSNPEGRLGNFTINAAGREAYAKTRKESK